MSRLPPGVDLCAVPAAKNPNGGKPNFNNPESLAPLVIGISVVMGTLSLVVTTGRVFMNRKRMHSADWLTIAACVFNIVFTGIVFAQIKMMRHQWDIPACWFTGQYLRIVFLQTFFIAPTFFTSKAAIFLLFRQLFTVSKRMKYAINFGILVTFLLYFPNIPLSSALMTPAPGDSWETMLGTTKAHKMIPWGIVQSAVSIALDFYIFFLPLPIIIHLNMPLKKKIQLSAVFGTALIGLVASVLSLTYRTLNLDTTDLMWQQATMAIAAIVENNVAIIVGCMPAFSQLIKVHVRDSKLYGSLRSRLRGTENNTTNSQGASQGKGPTLVTFGSLPQNRQRKQRNYYELTDQSLLKTQDTALNEPFDSSRPPTATPSESVAQA